MCSASIPTLFQYFLYVHIPTFFYVFIEMFFITRTGIIEAHTCIIIPQPNTACETHTHPLHPPPPPPPTPYRATVPRPATDRGGARAASPSRSSWARWPGGCAQPAGCTRLGSSCPRGWPPSWCCHQHCAPSTPSEEGRGGEGGG